MANVSLKNVTKYYDKSFVPAVNNFSLEIKDKEFVVFVGPSGCGKSTTLRMIAGLEEISDGDIYIGDKLVNFLEPKDRDIAMVFQDYALYPHMTVYNNMAFGLKLKRILKKKLDKDGNEVLDKKGNPVYTKHRYSKEEIDSKVREAAKILEIEDYLDRKPKALSGGQRQRVAIGRAIVRKPKVFLMDEPLSNLDAKLRNQMRSELILLRKRIQTTFIYVTHDQTEAMTLGDRIVVMKDGVIQQVGTPKEVFDHPQNLFVATFIGTPQMNLLKSIINDDCSIQLFDKKIALSKEKTEILKKNNVSKRKIIVGVRPEHFVVNEKGMFTGTVSVSEMMGTEYFLHLFVGEEKVVIKVPILNLDEKTVQTIEQGGQINFDVDPKSLHVFDEETSNNLF